MPKLRCSIVHILLICLILFLSTKALSQTNEHEFVIDIYPWHATVEIVGLTNPNFEITATGAGPQVSFKLPEGSYLGTASAEGYKTEEKTVLVPDNRNPGLHLNPVRTLRSFLPYELPITNFLIIILALSFIYGVLWSLGKSFTSPKRDFTNKRGLVSVTLNAQRILWLHCCVLIAAFITSGLLLFLSERRIDGGSGSLSTTLDALTLLSFGASIYHTLQAIRALPTAFTKSKYQGFWRRAFFHLEPSPRKWKYKELEIEGEGSTLHVRSAGDCDYLLHMRFNSGEITKRKGKLEVSSQSQLTQAIRDSKRLLLSEQKSSKDEFEKLIVYLPYASSADWNDRVGLGQIHYICGKPRQLAEQLNFWDEPGRERLDSIQRGRETEKKAVEQIDQHKPPEWEMKTGMMLSTGNGDVDIILYLPDKTKIVIDVKDYRGRVYPSDGHILRNDGKMWDGVLKGIKWQAGERRALPIIWQPEAYSRNCFTFQSVHFIAGDVHFLLRQLYRELKIGKVPRAYD